MRIADHLTARTSSRAARRPVLRGAGAVEVPALHGGLSRLRRLGGRQRRPGHRLARRARRASTTRCSCTPRTRASSSATTAGSTSGSCTRSRCGCRCSLSYPRAVAAGTGARRDRHERRLRADLLDAAGVPHHERMQGRSFWADSPATPRRPGRGLLLPLLGARRRLPPARLPTTATARALQAHLLLQRRPRPARHAAPSTYPPEWELYDLAGRPGGAAQRLRRPGVPPDPRGAEDRDVATPRRPSATSRTRASQCPVS